MPNEDWENRLILTDQFARSRHSGFCRTFIYERITAIPESSFANTLQSKPEQYFQEARISIQKQIITFAPLLYSSNVLAS